MELIKEIKLCKKDFIELSLSIIISFLVGDIITYAIMIFAKPDTYMSMGIIISSMVTFIMLLGTAVSIFDIYFDMAISMGRKRKTFLFNSFIAFLIVVIMAFVEIILLNQMSYLVYKIFFNEFILDEAFLKITEVGLKEILIISAIILAATSLLYSFSSLIKKFGRNILWIFWGIYMIAILFGGKIGEIIEQRNASNLLGKILINLSEFFNSFSVPMIYVFIAIILISLTTYSTYLFMKAEIKN